MQKAVQHVHIGTGKLGLGFVGYFSKGLGFNTVLLNRHHITSEGRNAKLQKDRQYCIRYYDEPSAPDTIPLADFHFFDEGQSTDLTANRDAIRLIADPSTTLLTTAVGESQLIRIAPLVAEGLRQRPATAGPLFVIACENGDRSSTRALKPHVPHVSGHAIFVDCVVDQICHSFELPPQSGGPTLPVTVSVESHREWIIDATPAPDLQQVLKHSRIRFVSGIEVFALRKLWLLNGFHLALAILGHRFLGDRNTRIADVLNNSEPALRNIASGVEQDLAEALELFARSRGLTMEDTTLFRRTTRLRFRKSPDSCARILEDAILDDERLRDVRLDFAAALGRDESLSYVLRNTLYDCVFRFFAKVSDRLYTPLSILVDPRTNPRAGLSDLLLSQKPPGASLGFVVQEVVPFLAGQGKRLRLAN